MTNRTQEQYIKSTYAHMRRRVEGSESGVHENYIGLEICDRDEFIQWALFDDAFHGIWDEWEATDFTDAKLGPSIDRIDPTLGYTFDNMQWKTRSMNSKRARYANVHGWDM